MSQRDLAFEIVKAIELGFNKHLARSFRYLPFRLFYNMFKKYHPQDMQRVRDFAKSDIGNLLMKIENFDAAIFAQKEQVTPNGKYLLTVCYNIGIDILRKELDVIMAFRLLRSPGLQEEIYHHVLSEVRHIVTSLLGTKSLPPQSKESHSDQH